MELPKPRGPQAGPDRPRPDRTQILAQLGTAYARRILGVPWAYPGRTRQSLNIIRNPMPGPAGAGLGSGWQGRGRPGAARKRGPERRWTGQGSPALGDLARSGPARVWKSGRGGVGPQAKGFGPDHMEGPQDRPPAEGNLRHPKKSERPRAPSFLPPKKTGAARGGPSRTNVFQNIPTANGEPLESGDYNP